MKKHIYIFCILFMISVPVPVCAKIVNGIACKVGDTIITINEFNRALQREKNKAVTLGMNEPDKSVVMDFLINKVLINLESEKRGIIVTKDELNAVIENIKIQNNLSEEQFLEELKRENITLDELKETYEFDILKARLINQMVTERINLITDSDIMKFYKNPQNKNFFTKPQLVKLSQIYIQVPEDVSYRDAIEIKNQVQTIYERAESGEDFRELVLLYSMDPRKQENFGSLGSFAPEQLSQIIPMKDVEKIFSLNAGEVAAPLRLRDGYYILKVDEKNEETTLVYEEAYENIKSYLLRLKGEELLNEKLLSMRKVINLKIMIEME